MPPRRTLSIATSTASIEFFARHRLEPHRVTGVKEEGVLPIRIVRPERGASDDVPPAGSHRRIHAGLAAGDRHRAGRYSGARRPSSRRRNLRIDFREVGETWNESDHVDPIGPAAVKGYHLFPGTPAERGDLGEIRRELPLVADRNLHDRAIAAARF